MTRTWTLAELLGLFPKTAPDSRAVLRCVHACRGHGRWVKQVRNRQGFGEVSLQAWPAEEFSLSCAYEWPMEVSRTEAEDLDRAVLQGVVEGAAEVEQPPWRSSIVCTDVGYKGGLTNAMAIRIAASLAVQDLVDHGEWIVEGSPPKDAA